MIKSIRMLVKKSQITFFQVKQHDKEYSKALKEVKYKLHIKITYKHFTKKKKKSVS